MELRRCYDILDVRPGVSLRELRQAYTDLVQVWHPDRFAHNPRLQGRAEQKLQQINEAYALLKAFLEQRARIQSSFNTQRSPAPDSPASYSPTPAQSHGCKDAAARATSATPPNPSPAQDGTASYQSASFSTSPHENAWEVNQGFRWPKPTPRTPPWYGMAVLVFLGVIALMLSPVIVTYVIVTYPWLGLTLLGALGMVSWAKWLRSAWKA